MKAHRPSRTAEHNALFRAIEYARRTDDQIVTDPIAKEFLTTSFRLVARLSEIRFCSALLCRYIDYRWPGARTSLVARTRLIDDHVASAISLGISQIVILGAGLDSRAYRIAGAERLRFFEVDHPNTSEVKRANIQRLFGALPAYVRYIALDFRCDQVPRSLEVAGFNPFERSLIIWEGVSNYLTEDAVRSTLSFVGSLVQGTELIFTYVNEAVLHDPAFFDGGREVQRTISRLEEPWTFGIRPEHASQFLKECGLCLDSDHSAADYRSLYYDTATLIRGYEFYHVVRAHVGDKNENSKAGSAQEIRHA